MANWFAWLSIWICLVATLDITNITSPVQLTKIFANNFSNINRINPGSMSYYISSNDPDTEKYLWYGMYYQLNNSIIINGLKSDIFDTNFNQYNAINNLPFTIVEMNSSIFSNGEYNQLFENIMCTSPITNDILTCWMNITWTSQYIPTYQVDCRLYFTKTNTFSNIIHITDDEISYNIGNGLICFDDSYFIPYFHYNVFEINQPTILYGTILDLKGNIVYSDQVIQRYSLPLGYLIPIFPIKSGSKINPKNINPDASSLLTLNFQLFNTSTNITSIQGLYLYYTNINDTRFPIYLYNESSIKHNAFANDFIQLYSNIVLDYRNDCCYMAIYTKEIDPIGQYEIYSLITDIYGNNINVKGYKEFEDILVIMNASIDMVPQLLDLQMISDDSIHYFMILYGEQNQYEFGLNTSLATVYYLQYDEQLNQYDLFNEETYLMATLQYNASFLERRLINVFAYNLPDTDYICMSWLQYGYHYFNHTSYNYYDMYGQTFRIN